MEIFDTPHRCLLGCKYLILRSLWQTHREQGCFCSQWSLFAPLPAVCLVHLHLVPQGCPLPSIGWKTYVCELLLVPRGEQACISHPGPPGWGLFQSCSLELRNAIGHISLNPFLSSYILLYGESKMESKSLMNASLPFLQEAQLLVNGVFIERKH